jgi:hypothetical protein
MNIDKSFNDFYYENKNTFIANENSMDELPSNIFPEQKIITNDIINQNKIINENHSLNDNSCDPLEIEENSEMEEKSKWFSVEDYPNADDIKEMEALLEKKYGNLYEQMIYEMEESCKIAAEKFTEVKGIFISEDLGIVSLDLDEETSVIYTLRPILYKLKKKNKI